MTKMEDSNERLGDEEPTKPGVPPSVERSIQNFVLSIAELGVDCGESARGLSLLEGDERRRRLLGVAEKMELSSKLIGDAAVVIRAIAELGG
jgi:hypothetical protein